jgi:hypothetical protein
MRKLISFLMAVLIALPLYSKDPEYTSVGEQFHTVVVNVPASITITKDAEPSVEITNRSHEFYDYKIQNDTLFINPKYKFYIEMAPELLEVKLKHPTPSKVYRNICTTRRGLNCRERSGNQK